MRLTDLPRTGSFRLALLFLALFGVASGGLFGFLYLQTQRFQIANIDDWLTREAPLQPGTTLDDVRRRFASHTSPPLRGPSRAFTLYDAAGRRVVGDALPMPRPIGDMDRPFFFTSRTASGTFRYRGLAHRFPGGEVALVAQNLHEAREFDEAFVHTAFWGGLLTALLGLGGAVVVAVGTVRRFDAAAFAIQEIMRGDLSRRLPTGGTSSDLDRLVIVVNAMLDEIERLMGEVKGVCDGIAHDLRTPLTRIVAGLERVQRRAPAPEGYAAAVDDAVDDLRTVLRTFGAMLRIAEIEDGARRKGFQDVDLPTIVQDVVDFYEPVAEDRSITLAFEHDPRGTPAMAGDPGLLFTAISNLVDNAMKFTPQGGRVAIEVQNWDGALAVIVSDTGCGIDPDEQNAVFRRFYRAENSRHSPGNGLGLALVAAIARLHDLAVEVEQLAPGTRIALVSRPASALETGRRRSS